ncbi:MAG TPA: outer membrane beta-barrel protein [Opitutaceae bacterium]|jgi:hypothetical protein|nr:outer membrane beta-barrel protein [Opitutaceae bacterium]
MKLAVVAAFAAALPAFAQIKINDSLSVTGWTVGSYQYTSTKGSAGNANTSSDSFNADAALLGATITPTKEVTGTVSFYYKPATEGGINGTSEVTLLDAYVAYDCGNGLVVTAGKFLSYLGYESFYAISDNMISLANQQFLAPIPGYHDGVKADYTVDKTLTFGGAVSDSEYSNNAAATEGDGHLKGNFGTEGYITYTGVENLTLWFGAGLDSKGGPNNPYGLAKSHSVYVLDFWASYQINKELSVAAEEIYKDGGKAPNLASATAGLPTEKGSNWLLYAQYLFTDKLSAWACFSGEDVSSATFGTGKAAVSVSGPKYWKASIAPAYALTANLYVKGQISYTKYSSYTAKSAVFTGVQVGFKF